MAQTGYTPIYLYYSGTATHIPLAANLGNGELAINAADGNLFYKNTSNAVVTVPVLQSSATQSGWLSSTDWTTFNSKQPAGTYVTSVSGTAPVVSSGGTTPAISMAAATGSVNGYLTSTDWTTFNGKQAALVSGTNIKTVNGTTLLGSGDVGTIDVAHGGTGVSSASITAFNNITGYTASGATGTTSTNLVFSGAPTFTGVAAFAQIRSTYDGSSGSPSLDLRNSNGAQWEWYTPTSDNSLKLTVWVPGQRDNVLSIQNVAGSHDVTVSTGNLVIGTSGKGIDFSAVVHSGSTSKLLADYEEGTFTPTVTAGSGSITSYTSSGNYTKIGRMVTYNLTITITNVGTGAGTCNATLPFTNGAFASNGSGKENGLTGYTLTAAISASTASVNIRTYANATCLATNAVIQATGLYYV